MELEPSKGQRQHGVFVTCHINVKFMLLVKANVNVHGFMRRLLGLNVKCKVLHCWVYFIKTHIIIYILLAALVSPHGLPYLPCWAGKERSLWLTWSTAVVVVVVVGTGVCVLACLWCWVLSQSVVTHCNANMETVRCSRRFESKLNCQSRQNCSQMLSLMFF